MSQYSFNNKVSYISTKLILFGFVCIFCGCQTYEDKIRRSQSEYRQLVLDFDHRGEIEETVSALKAVMTVVHIRQQHDSEIYTKAVLVEVEKQSDTEKQTSIKTFYETLLKINEVQKEIYEFVVSHTSEKHRVYLEGVPYPRSYRNLFAEAFRNKRLEAVKKILALSKVKLQLPEPAYYLGASFKLHKGKKTTVIGAEHGGLLNFTTDTYTNPKLSLKMKKDLLIECHEQREAQVIKNIVEPDFEANYIEPTVKFLIFGSMHDFSDNVKKWNEENPYQQIRLVTFTPKSL